MGVERLYYSDSYLRHFSARVIACDGLRLYLDRTAFYPASGGQPWDTGLIGGVPVTGVTDEDDQIAHLTAGPVEGDEVECAIDWDRRFDHMQQHSGQHLLSAVFVELYGIETVSFHLGEQTSTIDLAVSGLSQNQVVSAERWANRTVFENRPISVSMENSPTDLRKPTEREGALRVVTIRDLDRSACGGTHVLNTGEIGLITIRKLDRIRDNVRVEFLCGMRAVQRARADYEALSRVAQVFSAPLDNVPELAAAQRGALDTAERVRRKLDEEVSRYRGKELYQSTEPDRSSIRKVVKRAARMEDLRPLAQNFTSHPHSVFVGIVDDPPSLLLAASSDSGVDAGKALKECLAAAGGRGGGTARIAQGTVKDRLALEAVVRCLDAPG
jgi:alanyl-tRNA synthetase